MRAVHDHFCPGCGTALRLIERYPWYFCSRCLHHAESHDGPALVFFNRDVGGGFVWCHADEADDGAAQQDSHGMLCLILGRRVLVQEARFGGIVAQPVNDLPVDLDRLHLIDLSRPQRG